MKAYQVEMTDCYEPEESILAAWETESAAAGEADAALDDSANRAICRTEAVPDVPCGPRLEAFCGQIGRMFVHSGWRNLSPAALVEIVAHEFRQAFDLTVPVAPSLDSMLSQADIVRTLDDGLSPVQAHWDCLLPDGPWLIHLPGNDPLRQTIATLESVFAILFWRLAYRVAWWADWQKVWQIGGPGRLGTTFAYAVAMPPASVREVAHRNGLNIWRMSAEFLTSPSACFFAVRRYVRYEFPFFLARLNFQFELDQQQMFFAERAVRAKVWAKFLAAGRPTSAENAAPIFGSNLLPRHNAIPPVSVLDPLARFPRRDSVIEVGGFLLEAIRRGQPMLMQKTRLLGIEFGSPVAVVARPNESKTQLLIQAVPVGCHAFLMDGALWNQQQQARRAS